VVARLNRQQILEIYVLQDIIEATATRLAAQHAAAIEIEHLRDLVKEFASADGDLDRLLQINRQLHHTIYEASRNRYLIQWLDEFRDTMALLPYITYTSNERFRSARDEHSMIVEAISARDPEAAERAARLHVRNSQAQRMKMLFETQTV
jgi:DNA-binding GntR family transcriptional regulator